MRKILFVAISIFAGFSAQSQIEEIRRITEKLCSPEFHGRGYVNRGDSLAADYLVTEFKQLGLKPYKGEYLQHFSIDQVNTFPNTMSVKLNGTELTPGIDYVVDPSSGGFKGSLNPLVVNGVDLFDRDKLSDYIGKVQAKAGGKNALVLRLSDLSSDSLAQLMGISQSLATYIPIIELVSTKFTWSVGRNQIPNVCIQMQEEVFEEGQIEVDIRAKLITDYRSQNVMAYLPAAKKCKETIVFTAHYDHLGRMGSDTYFPGGNDNASGTAMLLTMAKYFTENPSKYNILFIAFAGEEAGLLGSKYFVQNTPIKLNKIRFLLNLDIMGSGEEGITAVNATLFEEEYQLLSDINDELGLLAKVKRRGPTQNSDHYWFTEKGVPSFFIYTMGTNQNYHDIFDTYENLTFSEYEDITKLLVTFVDRLD